MKFTNFAIMQVFTIDSYVNDINYATSSLYEKFFFKILLCNLHGKGQNIFFKKKIYQGSWTVWFFYARYHRMLNPYV